MKSDFQYIDNHAHVNFEDYDADRKEVIARALQAHVAMINVGTTLQTSKEVVALANEYESGVYAIVGEHPVHAATESNFDATALEALLSSPKVVGIGECGLDFFRVEEGTVKLQEEVFRTQLALAEKYQLPVMLHIRKAYDEAIAILKEFPKVIGNAHFFSGTQEHARTLLDMGYTVSFTGVITFTKDYDQLVTYVPLNRILSETDCPYVTPAPHRGKRNEPLFVQEVAHKIAEIRGEDVEVVREALLQNSKNLFRFS